MRTPAAAVASFLLAGSLVLSGCSWTSGSDDQDATSAAPGHQAARTSTAWTPAARAKVAAGGTLRLAAAMLPTNFNLQHADAVNTDAARILAPTVGGAIRITQDGGWKVDPDYAELVRVTDTDPLTVKVVLNPRAVWQDGTPITSADMIAFWKAQNGSDDAYEVSSTAGYEDISAITKGKDKFTYAVTFKKRTAEWPLYVYPRLPASVSSKATSFNTAFRKRAIPANGPFVVRSIDARRGLITQTPNPRWWGAKPKLRKITWNVATPMLQAKAFAADELDAVDLEAATYATVKDVGRVQRSPGLEWSQVTVNGGRGPLKDVNVRRAVARAIDRDAIATDAAKGLGARASTVGSLILMPGQRGYHDSSKSIAYDPKAAAALLAKAGWTKGAGGKVERDGKSLTLTMPVPRSTPTNSRRAATIARDLATIGVTLKLRQVPAARFFDPTVLSLDFDLVTFTRRGSAFPIGATEPLFYPIDSAQNFTGIGPARFGEGFDAALATLDDDARAEAIAKLDGQLLGEVPMIPLAVTPLVVAVQDDLVNYGAAQFEQPDWTRVGFTKKQ
jgi:peptide/nickel transport system substrate-binding protein